MNIYRVWQLALFELTRLFATKRGLLALAAFAMVWLMILRYPIGHAVPFLSSPQFSEAAQELAGNIGLRELVSWPQAELAIFWLIALYSFPLFSLFVCSDQTVGDRQRGTLRFLSLRSTRDELLLGRFFGQFIIIICLIALTALATTIVMAYRAPELALSGLGLAVTLICQLSLTAMPFIALMSLLNLICSSSRLSIVLAILLFTLGNALLSYLSSYLPLLDVLFYAFPGVQLMDIAPQTNVPFTLWLIPLLQSCALLALSIVVFRRRSL
ncbi:ABC transporter permease subunit [Pseudoalteromonas sp. JBTF-M23]|uniref:ABC transporter permease subunit n=1 Tax=Pseudoalteromonas caenipelagi TaxID=2726988 RepID=A0A849V7M8_9GAMM|nr:ABC transporter permease subunit [Pseudoalteromonas caenipelagi]NOU48938.1 ABC transporter permease subunit [Pseudoalteromonas caenipelagi]